MHSLFLCFFLLTACCGAASPLPNSPSVENTLQPLTLDDVRTLAEKGDALNLRDLAGFSHTDIGSGMYVFRFPIDGTYELLVSAADPEDKPISILLQRADGASIDIRTDGLETFLAD